MILLVFIDCWPCPCQATLQYSWAAAPGERKIEADNADNAVVASLLFLLLLLLSFHLLFCWLSIVM